MNDNPLVIWEVVPELLQLGPVTIRWYGLLFAMGFAVGFFIIRKIFRAEGKQERDLETLLTYVVVGTVIGARLGHCLFYDPDYFLSHPLEILKVWKGGLASHGGGIGVLISLWLYSRSRPNQPFLWLCDRVAIPTALAGAFIRLGNLFNSEIYGQPTKVAWSFVFKRIDEQARHPTQVYESISYLAIFALLWINYLRCGKQLARGQNLGIFLALVFAARFFIEFFKVRQASYGADWGLTIGQFLSIPAFIVGAFLLFRARKPEQG
ncbi:MAG: prolipoprotein diacylglyceryl transferase [Planctomycetota bacterium]